MNEPGAPLATLPWLWWNRNRIVRKRGGPEQIPATPARGA